MASPTPHDAGAARATCLVCEASADVDQAEASGWQRGACTCTTDPCPGGAVWLCPAHRTDRTDTDRVDAGDSAQEAA